jgi:hypothetical protein
LGGEGACQLPLRHFNLKGHHELTGTRLGVPTDLIGIDKEGRLSWNNSRLSRPGAAKPACSAA